MSEDALKSFIETASSVSPFRVEDDFGNGFVRLRSEEAERRQAAHDIRSSEDVVIEALRNARDAHAKNIFLATCREGDARRIVVIDDGDGVPPSMQERIFEPRVTSKLDSAHMDRWGVHGRGMALYSIKVNCATARVAASDVGKGAAFEFVSDTRSLGEKTDQSTFPSFDLTDSGTVSVRGPRNILRTACEFAVDSADRCTVYLGSPAEIAATLYAFACSTLSAVQRAFCSCADDLPVVKRLAICPDPVSMAQAAADIGLPVSDRTCRRIMDGELKPSSPLVDRIDLGGSREERKPSRAKKQPGRLARDDRGLKIDQVDLDEFSGRIEEAFSELARSYYLVADVSPEISVRKDRLVVSIPVQKL